MPKKYSIQTNISMFFNAQYCCKGNFKIIWLFFSNIQNTNVGEINKKIKFNEPPVNVDSITTHGEIWPKLAWLFQNFKSGSFLIRAVNINEYQIFCLAGFSKSDTLRLWEVNERWMWYQMWNLHSRVMIRVKLEIFHQDWNEKLVITICVLNDYLLETNLSKKIPWLYVIRNHFSWSLRQWPRASFSNKLQYHAISLVSSWSSKIIVLCFYRIYGFFYESRYYSFDLRHCVFGPLTPFVKMVFNISQFLYIFKSGCIFVWLLQMRTVCSPQLSMVFNSRWL